MSGTEKQIDAYIADIRSKFLEKKIPNRSLSWGQFLDSGGQVGLYGTVAAAIALKAKNPESPEAQAAEKELVDYWNKRTTSDSHQDNLCQNVRLAALLLGLSFRSQSNSNTVAEVANNLQSRFSEHEDLWGDSSNQPPNTPTTSEFSTAIVIIFAFQAIHLYKGSQGIFCDLHDRLDRAAKALQKAYVDDPKRPRQYLLLLLIAVELVLGKSANASVRRRLSQQASSGLNMFQRSWYHLDYIAASRECKRDYLIIPEQLLIAILFLQPHIPGNHFLYAKNALDKTKVILDSNESKLFKESTDRPSSLEQALVILALEASRSMQRSNLSLWFPKLRIAMSKKRSPEWLFAWALVLFGYVPLAATVGAGWLLDSFNPHLSAGFIQLLTAAQLLPSWIPTTVLLIFSAIREPVELAKAAIGKGERG